MPELILLREDKEVSRTMLGPQPIRVGRDADCHLVINDPRVSGTHLRITPHGEKFFLEDWRSTHGTFLADGKRVRERTLQDGDRIRVGGHELMFMQEDGKPLPAQKAAGTPDDVWDQVHSSISDPGSKKEGILRLQTLFEISRILEEAEDFPSALTRLMDKAISIMRAERGFIMLRDPVTGALKMHTARDCNERSIPRLEAETISRSVVEKVVATGRPVLLENALSEGWGTQSVLAHSIHSVLCAPMKTQGTVTGVLYVDHRSRIHAFSGQDQAFFTTLALQAKAAIDSNLAYWEIVEGLFTASGDMIVLCDPAGKITRVNSTAGVLMGMNEQELLEMSFAGLFTPEERTQAEALLQDALSQRAIGGRELHLSGDMGKVPMSISSFLLKDQRGNVTGACFIARDLTEMKSLISRLTDANAQLKKLNETKSEFVGMVSHELKNPLSVIHGMSQLMLDEEESVTLEARRDFLGRIHRKADQVIRMVSGLLDLTRIETGSMKISPAKIDYKEIFAEVIESQSAEAQKKNVTVKTSIPPSLPEIQGDADMLRRLTENFVSNGIKYNKEGGTLTLALEPNGSRYTLSFRDEGLGLSPENLAQLFGRFFRTEEAVKMEIPGTGLGLSIVAAITRCHGGSVAVESALGKGSIFRVELPYKPDYLEFRP